MAALPSSNGAVTGSGVTPRAHNPIVVILTLLVAWSALTLLAGCSGTSPSSSDTSGASGTPVSSGTPGSSGAVVSSGTPGPSAPVGSSADSASGGVESGGSASGDSVSGDSASSSHPASSVGESSGSGSSADASGSGASGRSVGSAGHNSVAPGSYTVEVTLSGGSGKAGVESPTLLTVTDDQMTAAITWTSPYYTWVRVGGVQYTPISAHGANASFEIPITLDTDISITAQTTAMSQPHDIDYTLRFDSSTLKSA